MPLPVNQFEQPDFEKLRKMFNLDQEEEKPKCKACEIENNNEHVKQMPVHTCKEKGIQEGVLDSLKANAKSWTKGDFTP